MTKCNKCGCGTVKRFCADCGAECFADDPGVIAVSNAIAHAETRLNWWTDKAVPANDGKGQAKKQKKAEHWARQLRGLKDVLAREMAGIQGSVNEKDEK